MCIHDFFSVHTEIKSPRSETPVRLRRGAAVPCCGPGGGWGGVQAVQRVRSPPSRQGPPSPASHSASMRRDKRTEVESDRGGLIRGSRGRDGGGVGSDGGGGGCESEGKTLRVARGGGRAGFRAAGRLAAAATASYSKSVRRDSRGEGRLGPGRSGRRFRRRRGWAARRGRGGARTRRLWPPRTAAPAAAAADGDSVSKSRTPRRRRWTQRRAALIKPSISEFRAAPLIRNRNLDLGVDVHEHCAHANV